MVVSASVHVLCAVVLSATNILWIWGTAEKASALKKYVTILYFSGPEMSDRQVLLQCCKLLMIVCTWSVS